MDWQLVIAIYATVISTLVLIWRLVEFYLEKAGRIKVKIKLITKIAVFNNILGDRILYYSVEVTNFSNHKRLIERPRFKTDLLFDGENIFSYIDFTDAIQYPLPFEPGEKREILYKKADIDEKFKRLQVKRIKAVIEDTLGKYYRSNWVSL